MLNLLIQAVFDRAAVAVWEEEKDAVCLEWQAHRDELQKLLPKIELALTRAGAGWNDIGKIVIVTGVGNFSATRISVTIANMLALVTKAELFEMRLDAEMPADELLEQVRKRMKQAASPGGRGPGKEWRSVKLARPVYRHAPTITPSKCSLGSSTAVRGAGKQPKKQH